MKITDALIKDDNLIAFFDNKTQSREVLEGISGSIFTYLNGGNVDINGVLNSNISGTVLVSNTLNSNISGNVSVNNILDSRISGSVSIPNTVKISGSVEITNDIVLTGAIDVLNTLNSNISGTVLVGNIVNSNIIEKDIYLPKTEDRVYVTLADTVSDPINYNLNSIGLIKTSTVYNTYNPVIKNIYTYQYDNSRVKKVIGTTGLI